MLSLPGEQQSSLHQRTLAGASGALLQGRGWLWGCGEQQAQPWALGELAVLFLLRLGSPHLGWHCCHGSPNSACWLCWTKLLSTSISSSFPPHTPVIAWQTKTRASAALCQGEIKHSLVIGRWRAATRRVPVAHASPTCCQQPSR